MTFLKHSFKSEFIKNVLTLMSGTVIAQGVAFILNIILCRIYSPSEFGDIALYMSIAGAFAVIATARYERAIVIAGTTEESIALIKISHIIAVGMAVINLLFVIGFIVIFSQNIGMSSTFKNWLYIMPIFTLLFGSSQALAHWFIRIKAYKVLAISKIINSLGVNLSMLLFGIIGLNMSGLYLGNFVGILLISLYLVYKYLKTKEDVTTTTVSALKIAARKYSDFPKTNTLQALVEMFQMYGIIYLLGIFFASDCIGLFSFSMKVLMAPMWLIGTSLSQVFYQKANEEFNRTHDLRHLFKKTIINSSYIALPILIILLIAGPDVFSLIFGEEWREAGVYARILSPWIFFDFIKAPLSQIPIITGRVKQMFSITLFGNLILLTTMIYGGWVLKDARISLLMLSISMSIYVVFLMIWIYKVSVKK